MVSLLISVFSLQFSAFSQSYAIDWHTTDGGGGKSTKGPMTNGQYSVTGGFWALPQAVQTEGAPTLTLAPASSGHATISWKAA